MRVLVTGAGGQLGHDLLEAFGRDDVLGLTSAQLDVTDASAVAGAVAVHRPAVVVNAAAYTRVDDCEATPEPAWRVNAGGAWKVARACAAGGAAMVHFSTDYVFDGRSTRPYTEFDRPNPQSVYARTKEAGEQLVRATLGRHYVVRTSWLQGAHGHNFVKTMLALGSRQERLTVVDDQVACPTFTPDLATAVRQLVETRAYGTYHLTGSGWCSWFQLATAIFQARQPTVSVEPITTEQFGAPAPRPAYSVLDNRMASLAGIAALPHWHDSLARLLSQLA